jgi:hypothetical protein
MSDWEESLQKEIATISAERNGYASKAQYPIKRIFDLTSVVFLVLGFVSLIAMFFTDITLVQATCFFVISFVLSPSDGDRFETMLKGMAQDLANIRASTTITSKELKKK